MLQSRFFTSSVWLGLALTGCFAIVAFFLSASLAMAAAPTGFTSQSFSDTDNTFNVETVTVVINGGEALDACDVSAGELATDWTYGGGNAINGSIASATCDMPSATITFTLTGATNNATGIYAGNNVAPTIAYDNDDGDNSISNASGDLGTVGTTTLTDLAKPGIYAIQTFDDDSDGLIDDLRFLWTENIDTDDGVAPLAADLPATLLPDGSTADFSSALIDDPANSTYIMNVTGVSGQVTVNTAIGATAISGDLSAKWEDAAANVPHVTAGTGNELTTDNAPPLIMSTTPADTASGFVRTASIVISFSEPMNPTFDYGTEFSSSPNPGGWVDTWSDSNKTVTLSHTAFNCLAAISIDTDDAEVDAATGNIITLATTGPQDGDWSFTTASCSSSGGSSSTPALTYTIDLTTPDGSENIMPNSLFDLVWTTGGTGTINYVDLSYSIDGGSTWILIADNTTNDGLYNWTVPNLEEGSLIKVKAEATDLATVMATDTSVSVTVGSTMTPVPEPTTGEPGVAPGSNIFGNSPVTGEIEEISEVHIGQYIKSPSFATVYYVDSNSTRRPFMDAQTFFTWADSFNEIVTVTDATLPTIDLGVPMLPKPGVVLVKIQSDAKTYSVTADPNDSTKATLHWIRSESDASSIYGSVWADYVIDIQPTLFPRYTVGSDVNNTSFQGTVGMKKRSSLHE